MGYESLSIGHSLTLIDPSFGTTFALYLFSQNQTETKENGIHFCHLHNRSRAIWEYVFHLERLSPITFSMQTGHSKHNIPVTMVRKAHSIGSSHKANFCRL